MIWFALLWIVGCVSETPSPEPVPEPKPEPDPEPEWLVSIPSMVPMQSPFVIWNCGLPFESRVKIIFDGKYEAGGLMGWSEDCKRQTILGLNQPGERIVQFEVDGELVPYEYVIKVLP